MPVMLVTNVHPDVIKASFFKEVAGSIIGWYIMPVMLVTNVHPDVIKAPFFFFFFFFFLLLVCAHSFSPLAICLFIFSFEYP